MDIPTEPKPRKPRLPLLVAALVLAGGLGAFAYLASDGDGGSAGPPSTATSTSTSESSTTTTGPDTTTAVWPFVTSSTRYDDAIAAARGFATDFVGFSAPVVGEFMQGDSRSGEVEIRPRANGPVTTVFVRQLGPDDRWWVLGAVTAGLQLAEPEALATVSSPVRLQGMSTAFEATVGVEIRQDDSRTPLATGFVMGGSMGEMGPFDSTFTFGRPGAPSGAVMLFTESMENGQIWEASVVRIHFGDAG